MLYGHTFAVSARTSSEIEEEDEEDITVDIFFFFCCYLIQVEDFAGRRHGEVINEVSRVRL